MAEVNITINGRAFGISCEDGQEQRVTDLGHYVDSRLKDISKAGAATNESHLLVLTGLLLADEVFDLRDDVSSLDGQVKQNGANENDEAEIAQAIESLAGRIDQIASRIQSA